MAPMATAQFVLWEICYWKGQNNNSCPLVQPRGRAPPALYLSPMPRYHCYPILCPHNRFRFHSTVKKLELAEQFAHTVSVE